MNYPVKTIKVNQCIAIVYQRGQNKGKPCLTLRYVTYEQEAWYQARLSYHLNVRSIPRCPLSMKNGLVLHTCDHNWCINPKHIYIGTFSQNMIDLWNRNQTIRNKFSKIAKERWSDPKFKDMMRKKKIGNQNRLGIPHTPQQIERFRQQAKKRERNENGRWT
jgi:hypothetical protein